MTKPPLLHFRFLASFVGMTAVFCVMSPSYALEPVSGNFVASKACEAVRSIKNKSNPGNVTLKPGESYKALGLNRAGGDSLQIVVPGAPQTTQRWVSLSCGSLEGAVSTAKPAATPQTKTTAKGRSSPASKNNLLALNWQPSFCENLTRTTECKQLNDGRMPKAARELTLHGLWPHARDKEYCNVPGHVRSIDTPRTWHPLPEPEMDRQTRKALDEAMPGAASHLDRHEWIKHGTCYEAEGGADEYYDDALHLLEVINRSPVGAFFRDNIGKKVSASDIRAVFDTSFGKGSGERVRIRCEQDGRRTLISELWISIYGDISPDSDLSHLLLAARPVRADCEFGILDRAGLQ